jgi:hypothetical protein
MPFYDIYGERKAMEVRDDTWGHLAPVPRRKYNGTILLATSTYAGENTCIINTDFPDLPSSPWFYAALCDYLCEDHGFREGKVYFWTGTYRFSRGRRKNGRDRHLDEGSHRFTGTFRHVPAPGENTDEDEDDDDRTR